MTNRRPARRYQFILLAILLLFTLFEELYLRCSFWLHYGSRSVVAGSLPNFVAVLVVGVGYVAINPLQEGKSVGRPIAAIVVGLTLYEVAQIWMPNRTFDWNDLLATMLGGVVCWLLLVVLAWFSRLRLAQG